MNLEIFPRAYKLFLLYGIAFIFRVAVSKLLLRAYIQ